MKKISLTLIVILFCYLICFGQNWEVQEFRNEKNIMLTVEPPDKIRIVKGIDPIHSIDLHLKKYCFPKIDSNSYQIIFQLYFPYQIYIKAAKCLLKVSNNSQILELDQWGDVESTEFLNNTYCAIIYFTISKEYLNLIESYSGLVKFRLVYGQDYDDYLVTDVDANEKLCYQIKRLLEYDLKSHQKDYRKDF